MLKQRADVYDQLIDDFVPPDIPSCRYVHSSVSHNHSHSLSHMPCACLMLHAIGTRESLTHSAGSSLSRLGTRFKKCQWVVSDVEASQERRNRR